MQEQTFFAQIEVTSNDNNFTIDARPSDSIALALKTGAKILVSEELFQTTTTETAEQPPMPTDPETLRERLRKINPEDFGKYSL